jgi:hypothetical protein
MLHLTAPWRKPGHGHHRRPRDDEDTAFFAALHEPGPADAATRPSAVIRIDRPLTRGQAEQIRRGNVPADAVTEPLPALATALRSAGPLPRPAAPVDLPIPDRARVQRVFTGMQVPKAPTGPQPARHTGLAPATAPVLPPLPPAHPVDHVDTAVTAPLPRTTALTLRPALPPVPARPGLPKRIAQHVPLWDLPADAIQKATYARMTEDLAEAWTRALGAHRPAIDREHRNNARAIRIDKRLSALLKRHSRFIQAHAPWLVAGQLAEHTTKAAAA